MRKLPGWRCSGRIMWDTRESIVAKVFEQCPTVHHFPRRTRVRDHSKVLSSLFLILMLACSPVRPQSVSEGSSNEPDPIGSDSPRMTRGRNELGIWGGGAFQA